MKHADGSYTRLAQRNVDVGLGLERLLAMLNDATVYETDLYAEALQRLERAGAGNGRPAA